MTESIGDNPSYLACLLTIDLVEVSVVVIYAFTYNTDKIWMWRQIISHDVGNYRQAFLSITYILFSA